MRPTLPQMIALIACPLLAAAAPVHAANGTKGDKNEMCILSNYIEDAPVIDSHTILVRMNPGRGYKRIDLASDCAALADGAQFSFATSVNRLCVQDTIRVRQPGGGTTCVISKIVTIDADEAKALLAQRR